MNQYAIVALLGTALAVTIGMAGFSGAFVSQILNEKNPARVDSKHIERIVRAVIEGETKYHKRLGIKPPEQNGGAAPQEKKTLDYHLNAIDALGWKIMGLERKA